MKIISGLGALAPDYDAVFCDVWGVVHNGRRHFVQSCEALNRYREGGGVVILVTNAPRPHPPVREQLAGLGVPRQAFDDIVTSGDVTLARIAERGEAPLYHIGPPRDESLFAVLHRLKGLQPLRTPLDRASYVVCTGLFDDRTETPENYDSILKEMLARRLDMISANPDIVVHVGDSLIYCSGAIAERYAAAGGRVIQAGKPFAPIYEEAMKLAAAKLGKTPDRTRILAIGDGMRTDVRGARDFGLDCLFVTSGVHRDELHLTGDLDEAALKPLFETAGVAPTAVIPELVW